MTDEINIEMAHKLAEREHERPATHRGRMHEALEIVEVLMLAIVAVATAWTGLQAATWDGQQSILYGDSSTLRTQGATETTLGAQFLAADAANFTAWLQAHSAKNTELQDVLVRRFTPEFHVAFDAWLATNPFTNPDSPPGPGHMKEYKNPHFVEAERLNKEADRTFEDGTHARETSEKYLRDTVLFASVLFLVAISQRAKARVTRLGGNLIALGMLLYVLLDVTSLPRH